MIQLNIDGHTTLKELVDVMPVSTVAKQYTSIMNLLDSMLEFMKNAPADYKNGVDVNGVDEGETIAYRLISNFEKQIKGYK